MHIVVVDRTFARPMSYRDAPVGLQALPAAAVRSATGPVLWLARHKAVLAASRQDRPVSNTTRSDTALIADAAGEVS